MNAELIILGCGDSAGVPKIGNRWGKCDPNEPRNNRTRPSIAIRSQSTTLVVDTGPDFRVQLNREDIDQLTAVLYTHAHADHVAGMDDIRPWFEAARQRVPIYLTQETLRELNVKFAYIFEQKHQIYPAIVEPYVWQESQFCKEFKIGDIPFIPFKQDHGHSETIGFRFGNTAYSTDLVRLDANALEVLKGIKTWIVDGANLYFKTPVVHLSLDKILDLNAIIGARKIYLTHLKNDLDYQTLRDNLPPAIEPAYDGLKISVQY